jgi:hypothetical protein
MELLLSLAVLIVLGVAAVRWGHDSRDASQSDEAILAARGYAWTGRGGLGY